MLIWSANSMKHIWLSNTMLNIQIITVMQVYEKKQMTILNFILIQ